MNKVKSRVYVDFSNDGVFIGELHNFIILKEGKLLSYDDILNKLNPFIKKVTIKGEQKDNLIPLIKKLIDKEYFTIIELTGLEYDKDIVKYADFLSIDLKTPSAGIKLPDNQFEILSNYILNHPNVQIKAVISNKEDLDYAIDMFMLIHDKHPYTPLIFTSCWVDGVPSNKLIDEIKNRLIEEKIDYIRVVLQQHKMIYGSKKRGV